METVAEEAIILLKSFVFFWVVKYLYLIQTKDSPS